MKYPEIQTADMAQAIAVWREGKGFRTPADIATPEERTQMMEKLMLVVTEISEAAEAVRHNNYQNFVEELADTVIRILDICGTCKIDLDRAITMKMYYNATRPEKHGKEL